MKKMHASLRVERLEERDVPTVGIYSNLFGAGGIIQQGFQRNDQDFLYRLSHGLPLTDPGAFHTFVTAPLGNLTGAYETLLDPPNTFGHYDPSVNRLTLADIRALEAISQVRQSNHSIPGNARRVQLAVALIDALFSRNAH
jgi:hypothetical protein